MNRSTSEMQTVLAMGLGMMAAQTDAKAPQNFKVYPLPPHLRSEAIGERSSKRRRQRRRGTRRGQGK